MTAARRASAKALTDTLKSVPCHDCGRSYPPHVMDFDHLGGKLHNVAVMVSKGYSLASIRAEALKCQVVCANCHRIRTHLRRTSMTTIIDGIAYDSEFLPETFDAPDTVDALPVGPDVEAVADAKQAAADLITGGDDAEAPATVDDANSAPEFDPVADAAPLSPQEDAPVITTDSVTDADAAPAPAETEAVPAETEAVPAETDTPAPVADAAPAVVDSTAPVVEEIPASEPDAPADAQVVEAAPADAPAPDAPAAEQA